MDFTTRPELVGSFGMISSTHWLASAAGMGVLERGGNAFDAAVAAGFVLQVVEPHLNGPGGEVVMLVQENTAPRPTVVCGQGTAPRRATVDTYRQHGFVTVPGTGLWAACVPGAFDAWMAVLARHGTITVREALTPAINYAATGYPVIPKMAGSIAASREVFTNDWTSSAATYLPGGRIPHPGSRFTNPDLASTYQRIVTLAEQASQKREAQIQAARDAWYRGFVAERMAGFVASTPSRDGTGTPTISLLDEEDLAAHETRFEKPRTTEYRGFEAHKAGPWSQGPVFLQQLSLLAGFDLTSMGPGSVEHIHTVTESAKLAMADRDAWYGDPDEAPDRIDGLLASHYAEERRRLIRSEASHELRPGSPDGSEPRILQAPPGIHEEAGAGEPTLADYSPEHGDTCQLDVIDRHGNMVAATPSGGWLQGSPVIPGLGFGLGTRLQMTWLDDDHPSALKPGRRPRTTLTPTIVTRDGRPELAFGTPGGDRQDQWSLTFFVSVVDFGMNLQEAIDAVMFHTDHLVRSFAPRRADPGTVTIEGRADSDIVDGLRARGHKVEVQGDWSLGRIAAVGRSPQDGLLRAAANPRGMQGYAVGR